MISNEKNRVLCLLKDKITKNQTETAVKCRICRELHSKDVIQLASVAPFGFSINLTYAEVYHYVTGYDNTLESGPQFLCRVCTIDLSVAYDFKKKCVKSEQLYERHAIVVKQEKVEDEPENEEEETESEKIPDANHIVLVPEYDGAFKREESFSERSFGDRDDDDTMSSFISGTKEEIMSDVNDDVDYTPRYDRAKRVKRSCVSDNADESFECPFCHELFTSISSIIEHIHYEHNGRKMKCDEENCKFLCELPFQLEVHKKKVHLESRVKPSTCMYCEKFSGLGKDLVEHCQVEHPEKESKCSRGTCEFTYFFPYQLERHDKQSHTVQKKIGSKYKCPNCCDFLETRTRLRNHQFEKHGIAMPAPRRNKPNPHLKEVTICPHCGKSLKVATLPIHIQLVHEKLTEGFYICDLCGKHYSNKISLASHMQYLHKEKPPIQCRYCSETFSNHPSRNYHEARFHTQNFKHVCKICGQKFYGLGYLNRHMIKHTGVKNFQCEICDGKFSRKTTLKNHMVTHSDERPFSCNICGSSYKVKSALNSHMRVHQKGM